MAHSAYPELENQPSKKLLDCAGIGSTDILAGRSDSRPDHGEYRNDFRRTRAEHYSDAAKAELAIRLVGDGRRIDQALRTAVGTRAEVKEILELPAMHFKSLDGFPTSVVSFTTDISRACAAWGEPFLLGGQHSRSAYHGGKISKRELLAAVETYAQMTRMLLSRAEALHA